MSLSDGPLGEIGDYIFMRAVCTFVAGRGRDGSDLPTVAAGPMLANAAENCRYRIDADARPVLRADPLPARLRAAEVS